MNYMCVLLYEAFTVGYFDLLWCIFADFNFGIQQFWACPFEFVSANLNGIWCFREILQFVIRSMIHLLKDYIGGNPN